MTISKRWAIVLFAILVVSLGANLLIAGFSFARLSGGGPRLPPIDAIVAIGIRAFPPPIQQAIRGEIEAERTEIRARLDAVQAARRQMFEALRADPFDQEAVDAAFVDLRTRTTELQVIGQDIVTRAVSAAPADVRAEIKPPRRNGPRQGGDDDDGPRRGPGSEDDGPRRGPGNDDGPPPPPPEP